MRCWLLWARQILYKDFELLACCKCVRPGVREPRCSLLLCARPAHILSLLLG